MSSRPVPRQRASVLGRRPHGHGAADGRHPAISTTPRTFSPPHLVHPLLSFAKTRSPVVSTTWKMRCNVAELGYMRPRRGILESDEILARDRCAPRACPSPKLGSSVFSTTSPHHSFNQCFQIKIQSQYRGSVNNDKLTANAVRL